MAGHIYEHPLGWKVPSPSGIIGQLDKSGPLTYWAANCACDYILQELKTRPKKLYPIIEAARKNFRSVSAEARDIGSAVHEAIRRYLQTGQEPQAPVDQVLSGFLAFLEWEGKHELKVIKTEHTVYDPVGMYAGTLDLLCVLDKEKKYVIDFKTTKQPKGNRPYEEWAYQLAAYRACVPDVEGMGIVRLDKETGEPDWYDLSGQYQHALEIFDLLTKLWWLRHPKYKKAKEVTQ